MNKSEINPVEYRVLVKPEKIEDTDPVLKAARAAGIELPNDPREREQMAQQDGVVVAIGGNAFSDWKGLIPQVGHRVKFAKYAGYNVQGADNELYRMLNDKDISAVVGPAVSE